MSQPLFHNTRVKTEIPTNNAAGFKVQPLNPRYFGIPDSSNIRVIDIFSACRFIAQEQLETLLQRDQDQEDFRIQDGSYLRLKRALKFVTGMKEQNEGVRLSFPLTIPALDPKPFKYSSSSLRTFSRKIKKVSQ